MRTLAIFGACVLATGMAMMPAGAADEAGAQQRSHVFDVLLDGRPVGSHRFDIRQIDARSEAITSAASFNVKILGLTVYRYRHEARETWHRGCLVQLVATTSDNGDELEARAAREGDVFRVSSPQQAQREGCVAAYAYWDRERLLAQRELLNPQTGRFDDVRFESLGTADIEVDGRKVQAHHHRLHGPDGAIDLWYGDDGEWLQLASRVRGDRTLLYRRAR